LGWLVGRDTPLVFLVGADQDRAELVRQCHQIGYDRIIGELGGGLTAWTVAGLHTRATPLTDASQAGSGVLDVRQDREHADGHIPGVTHLELGRLTEAADRLGARHAGLWGEDPEH